MVIELHAVGGKSVWVNADNISMFSVNENNFTHIWFTTSQWQTVEESPLAILKLVNAND